MIERWQRERVPRALAGLRARFSHIPELLAGVHPVGPEHMSAEGRTLAALIGPERLRRILARMLDEQEFLSAYGIRSVSKFHEKHPYTVQVGGKEYSVSYQPAESDSGMFGGNSNWRGPVWFPINILLIRSMFQFYMYYGDSFRIECPTGSGNLMTLFEVGKELSERLQRVFTREPSTHSAPSASSGQAGSGQAHSAGSGQARSGEAGRRAVFGGTQKFQNDPHWRDCIPFYEYIHGDNGAGLGASHQTGWTALVAALAQVYGSLDARTLFEAGRQAAVPKNASAARVSTGRVAVTEAL